MKYSRMLLQARFLKYNLNLDSFIQKVRKKTANAFPTKSHRYTRLGHHFRGVVNCCGLAPKEPTAGRPNKAALFTWTLSKHFMTLLV